MGALPGEQHPLAKLTEDKVREIRRRYAEGGTPILELADEYDISYSTCRSALTGRTWKHVR